METDSQTYSLDNRIISIFDQYKRNLKENVLERQNELNRSNIYQKVPEFDYESNYQLPEIISNGWNNYDLLQHNFANRQYEDIVKDELKNLMNQSPSIRQKATLGIQSYTSVIESNKEQPWYCVISDRSIKNMDIYIIIADSEIAKCELEGNIIKTIIPPLTPGLYYLKIRCGNYDCNLKFSITGHSNTAEEISALPITSLETKNQRNNPKLCYNKAYQDMKNGKALLPGGQFTKSEIKKLQDSTSTITTKANLLLPNKSRSGPKFVSHGKCVYQQKSDKPWNLRIEEFSKLIKGKTMSDDVWYNKDTVGERITTSFRFALRESCGSSNLPAIDHFHANIFKLDPLQMKAANIFMKTGPREKQYSIFSFSLTPESIKGETFKDLDLNQKLIASLDRFEATDRLCSDPRFWRYVDGVMPSKTERALNFQFKQGSRFLSCPIPPALSKSKSLDPLELDTIEIAPYVYLYYEEVDPKSHDKTCFLEGLDSSDNDITSPDPHFTLVLSIADRLYISILPIGKELLEYITHDWLSSVPLRKIINKEEEISKIVGGPVMETF